MKDPRAMSCATLREKTICPSDEVNARAFDPTLDPDGNSIPMEDVALREVFREVDHICQACEVYEPIEGT